MQEEMASDYIAKEFKKPVIAHIAGRCTPEGKCTGHGDAIVEHGMVSVAAR